MGPGDVPIGLVMFTVGAPILAIMVIFAMWFASRAFQARMTATADVRYRALADQAVAAQSETAASLAALKVQLADVGASVAAVEKLLKQVG